MARKVNCVDINMIIASKLKTRRILLGMTQCEVAKLTGLACSTVHEYENSQVKISAVNLYKLSKLYKVSIDYFFRKLYRYNKPVKSIIDKVKVDYGKEEVYYDINSRN